MRLRRHTETRITSVDEQGDWRCIGVFRDLGHVGGAGGDGKRCCNCGAWIVASPSLNGEEPHMDLDAIRERVEKATPGPWRADWLDSEQSTYCVVAPALCEGGWGCIARTSRFERGWHDAQFMAAASEDVPALLEALDEAVGLLRLMTDPTARMSFDAYRTNRQRLDAFLARVSPKGGNDA